MNERFVFTLKAPESGLYLGPPRKLVRTQIRTPFIILIRDIVMFRGSILNQPKKGIHGITLNYTNKTHTKRFPAVYYCQLQTTHNYLFAFAWSRAWPSLSRNSRISFSIRSILSSASSCVYLRGGLARGLIIFKSLL